MGAWSFVQTLFFGGEWSKQAQGRMQEPAYKTGLNVCLNAYPLEEGAWIRRAGFRYLAHTKGALSGRLMGFDFKVSQPYQAEFTDGFLRFYFGLNLLPVVSQELDIQSISTATPAVVKCTTSLPTTGGPTGAGWATGDTVIFHINSNPCSTLYLCNRQFVMTKTAADSFSLADAITNAPINGAFLAYTAGATPDTVEKVLEFVTPYVSGQWATLRQVQTPDYVLYLHTLYAPRAIVPVNQFEFITPEFLDGPYFDINSTTTTMTPSGVSGSVTVTASSIVGINQGQGFLATDVNRLMRIQGAPADWSSGTTYAAKAIVLGSDQNIYSSVKGGNLNHNPTTDDGTWWIITDQTIVWSWGKITAVGSTTSVTVSILGLPLSQARATTQWQLGLYSDTTGYPTMGTFHEGRLWLTGVIPNRIDGSKADDTFNFAPTGEVIYQDATGIQNSDGSIIYQAAAALSTSPTDDGSVADDNSIAAVFNSLQRTEIQWMLSTDDGMMMGTDNGEWRVRASVLDDPITPTDIQVRRVSMFSCANMEPIQAWGGTVFVQKRTRKVMAHHQIGEDLYHAENLSKYAMHLTQPGIAEIRWMQEPNLLLWARNTDGSLVAASYKKDAMQWLAGKQPESYVGWHPHILGGLRTCVSLSTGPSFDGKSDAVYIVTYQPDATKPDFGQYWVETMMPTLDAGAMGWASWNVDESTAACCANIETSPVGGIQFAGFWHLNGYKISAYVGGLDLGDFLVTNGVIFVPWGSDEDGLFTQAFLVAITALGIDYGIFAFEIAATADVVITPDIAANNMLVPDNAVASVLDPYDHNNFTLDTIGDRVFRFHEGTGTTKGIGIFDGETGAVLLEKSSQAIGGGSTYNVNTPFSYHDSGFLVLNSSDGSVQPRLSKVNASTLAEVDYFGGGSHNYGTTQNSPPFVTTAVYAIPVRVGASSSAGNFYVQAGFQNAPNDNEISVLDINQFGSGAGAPVVFEAVMAGYPRIIPFRGKEGAASSTFFMHGRDQKTLSIATTVRLWKHTITAAGAVTQVTVRDIVPADVDAAWTSFTGLNMCVDQSDGNVILLASSTGATNKYYAAKIDKTSGAFIWKVTVPADFTGGEQESTRLHYGRLSVWTTAKVYIMSLVDGSTTNQTWDSGLVTGDCGWYDDLTQSITLGVGSYAAGSPAATLIGAYLGAHPAFSNNVARIFLGLTTTVTTQGEIFINVPAAFGLTYTSCGQLLRPDFGPDAGAQLGPAFGKKRRVHWYGVSFVNAQKVSIGTDFVNMHPVKMQTKGGTKIAPPNLFTGIVSDTIECDYSFEAQIAWQITRPFPCTVAAMSGYIQTTDK